MIKELFDTLLIDLGLRKPASWHALQKTKADLVETMRRAGYDEDCIKRRIWFIENGVSCPLPAAPTRTVVATDLSEDWDDDWRDDRITLLPDMEHGLNSRGGVVLTGLLNQEELCSSHDDFDHDNFQAMDDFNDYQSHWD